MQRAESNINDCWNRIGMWRTGKEKCPELDTYIHCRNCPVYSKSGRKLLRTEPPEGYRSEWTKLLAQEKTIKPMNVKAAFVFRSGNDWLALPSHMIQEVVNIGQIHAIPNITSKVLRGLVNIHGRLQICVSIGRVLGIEKRIRTAEELEPDYISPERLVVVRQDSHHIAFPVSEVKGIVHYTPDMIKEPPVTVTGSKAVYTEGILQIDGKDIGLLKNKPLFKTLTKDFE
jgi:chemotaxis-related protein WspD